MESLIRTLMRISQSSPGSCFQSMTPPSNTIPVAGNLLEWHIYYVFLRRPANYNTTTTTSSNNNSNLNVHFWCMFKHCTVCLFNGCSSSRADHVQLHCVNDRHHRVLVYGPKRENSRETHNEGNSCKEENNKRQLIARTLKVFALQIFPENKISYMQQVHDLRQPIRIHTRTQN